MADITINAAANVPESERTTKRVCVSVHYHIDVDIVWPKGEPFDSDDADDWISAEVTDAQLLSALAGHEATIDIEQIEEDA